MAKYVLVEEKTDVILKTVDGNKEFRTGKPPVFDGKPFRWLEYIEVIPSHEASQITEASVITITDTQYTKTWPVRDKTKEELDADKEGEAGVKVAEWKALINALYDGSFIIGQNLTDAQLKTIIKEHL